jgi:hypothetical protein
MQLVDDADEEHFTYNNCVESLTMEAATRLALEARSVTLEAEEATLVSVAAIR